MPPTQVLRFLVVALILLGTAACTRTMGRLSDVQLRRVEWAEVEKDGLSVGCCSKMEWFRVDFLSDMDYARQIKHGVHLSIRYGWCPINEDHYLSSSGLRSATGEVDGKTTMVPAEGHAKPPLYAYHGFFPSSLPARRYPQPGEGNGAYDLRNPEGDFCIAVAGGTMWWGPHGQSKGGMVPRAALLRIVEL